MTAEIIISIPEELKQKLDERIKQTNFKSIQDYLLFILEQMFSGRETERKGYTKEEEAGIKGNVRWDEEDKKRKGYSGEEEADLKESLEDLGYM